MNDERSTQIGGRCISFGRRYSYRTSSSTSLPAGVFKVETAVVPGGPSTGRPAMGAAMAAAAPRGPLGAPTRLVMVVVRVGTGTVTRPRTQERKSPGITKRIAAVAPGDDAAAVAVAVLMDVGRAVARPLLLA